MHVHVYVSIVISGKAIATDYSLTSISLQNSSALSLGNITIRPPIYMYVYW